MEKEGIEVGTSVVFSWEDCRWEGTSKKNGRCNIYFLNEIWYFNEGNGFFFDVREVNLLLSQ